MNGDIACGIGYLFGLMAGIVIGLSWPTRNDRPTISRWSDT